MSPRILAGSTLVLAYLVSVSSSSAASGIVEAIALDAVPERIGYQPPSYPAELVADGAPVNVPMTLVIDLDGSVRTIEKIESPRPEFEAAARAAVERWRFQSGFIQGLPTRYRLNVTVPFRTEGNERNLATVGTAGEPVVVSEPSVDWEVAPAYPTELAAEPRDGIAVVNVMVDAVGVPSDPVVEYASHPAFAASAGKAVLSWKFAPAEHEGGRLVSARTHVTMRFRKADAVLSDADRKRIAQLENARNYDVAPDALLQVPLVYPYDALLQNQRGNVSLNLLVSPEGQVVNIVPDPGSSSEFALAAGACVACWSFQPATRNSEPVFGWVKWQLVFTEDSGEMQYDDVSRELLAALRAGTFKPTPGRELDKPVTPRERIAPKMPPGQGPAAAGDAVVEVIVDRNGRVQLPRVIKAPTPASGYAAATAALRWRFEPPRKGGEPVDVRVKIPFHFVEAPAAPAAPPPASGG